MTDFHKKLIECGGRDYWNSHKQYYLGFRTEDYDTVDYLLYSAFMAGKNYEG
tara:strand:+ start:1190 stop:1345 length:156 start_codon:yes stop_codon:yes gene_type:complete